jgi:hypothetical protein
VLARCLSICPLLARSGLRALMQMGGRAAALRRCFAWSLPLPPEEFLRRDGIASLWVLAAARGTVLRRYRKGTARTKAVAQHRLALGPDYLRSPKGSICEKHRS